MSNVRVCAKIRPQSKIEDREGSHVCVTNTETQVKLQAASGEEKFTFDYILGQETNQLDVFDNVGVSLVDDCLKGFNCTLFVYGQSGAGKTFTMEGPEHTGELAGLIPRITYRIFEDIAKQGSEVEFAVKVSYVEIYNERVRDLLDDLGTKDNLAVRQDKVKGVYIQGVTEEYCCDGDEALAVMRKGGKNRAVASTGMNEGSSRSHAVFMVEIEQKNLENGSLKTSKMTLCDLAGSETAKKTGAKGQQMEEAKSINKSLSALGQVIKAMTDPKIKHIPFRDSKLTRMLQDAIGGNSRTTLMICLSPSKYNVEESVGTCRFGARAKMIKNKAKVNQLRSVAELEKILGRLEAYNKAAGGKISALQKLLEKHNVDISDLGIDIAAIVAAEQASSGKRPSGKAGSAAVSAVVGQVHAALSEEMDLSSAKQAEADKLTALYKAKENEVRMAEMQLEEAKGLVQRLEAEASPEAMLEQQKAMATSAENEEDEIDLSELEKAVDAIKAENDALKKAGTNAWDGERQHLQEEILKLKKDLEAARGNDDVGAGGADGDKSPDESAKQRKQMQSLQQRLEQMVLVHKSILRKHASAELKHREANKKLVLRDARIKQLEETARAIGETMRQQAEGHMAEMAKVREQVAKLRETSKNGGFFKKTVRGGTQ